MSREEAEQKIAEKLKEIKVITEEYGVVSGYLVLTITNNCIMFNNESWSDKSGHDYNVDKVLDYYERGVSMKG